MPGALWFPRASRSQTFGIARPQIIPNVLVLHTTEGNGWPAYDGGRMAPHITYRTATREFRQHYPANVAAMALADAPGGVTTNKNNVFQVEISDCTSGWASGENPSRPYTIGRKSADLTDDNLRDLAELWAWLAREWNVPLVVTPRGFVSWRTSSRMTASEWNAFRGLCGHQHVPENDHTDPGAINAARILEHARRLLGQPAQTQTIPAPAPGTDDWWPLEVGKGSPRVTRLGERLAELGFDWHHAGARYEPGPTMGAADVDNLREFLFTHGLYPENGYAHNGLVWPREYGAVMEARRPNIPAANFRNDADGAAARWLKAAGIKAGVLDPAWPWSRNGERGPEWSRLVRRLQVWLGGKPDPEGNGDVCYIGPSQNARLSQRLRLWDL